MHGRHCWCAWVEAVVGGGCLSFAGVRPGALSGGMVLSAPVPGEGVPLERKGTDLNETSSRREAVTWLLPCSFGSFPCSLPAGLQPKEGVQGRKD